MSGKEKQALDRFESLFKKMSDRELENLLLIGEGMAIAMGIKDVRAETEKKPA